MTEPREEAADVLVVGGGATGLAAALGFSQAGLRVQMFGVADQVRDDGRSAALLGPSLRFLASLGVDAALKAAGAPLAAIRIIDVAGGLFRAPTITFRAQEIGCSEFGWNVANAAIIDILAAAVRNDPHIKTRAALVAELSAAAGGLSAKDFAGGAVRAKLVVGADGRNSAVRTHSRIAARRWRYPQAALTCRLKHDADHSDMSLEFHTREGPFTLVPAGHCASNLVWVGRPERIAGLRRLDPTDLALRIEAQSALALGKIRVDGPVGSVPLGGLVARRLAGARVALVGEAAHAFPPIGAQGLNLGLADVAHLVRLVSEAIGRREDIGSDRLLNRYEAARRLDVETRTLGVDLLNGALIADTALTDLARTAGLALLARLPPLKHAVMRAGLGTQSPAMSNARASLGF